MNLAVLIIEGEDAPLAEMKAILDIESECEWTRGAKSRGGRIYAASGFSITLADVSTPQELKEAVVTFVRLCAEKGVAFHSRGLEAGLSLGFTVGDSLQFIAGFDFSPVELKDFSVRTYAKINSD